MNKRNRHSQGPRLSDTRYSDNLKRHLSFIPICCSPRWR